MPKYITTDELKEWVENWFYKNRCYHPYAKSNTIPIKELYDIVENMPAADVVEVKHGRWIWKDHYLVCSECGKENDRTNYCPNCGASMTKGEANG